MVDCAEERCHQCRWKDAATLERPLRKCDPVAAGERVRRCESCSGRQHAVRPNDSFQGLGMHGDPGCGWLFTKQLSNSISFSDCGMPCLSIPGPAPGPDVYWST